MPQVNKVQINNVQNNSCLFGSFFREVISCAVGIFSANNASMFRQSKYRKAATPKSTASIVRKNDINDNLMR